MTGRRHGGLATLAILSGVVALGVVAWEPAPSQALPRFAARTGQACGTCHVNPTGGGMRRDYGREVYAHHALPVRWGGRVLDPGFSPSLPFGEESSVSFGADLRLAYLLTRPRFYRTPVDDQLFRIPPLNTFFLMQADLYVATNLGRYVSVYLDKSVVGPGFEAFVLAHNLPGNLYLKAGQFVPPYGLKLPNHQTFIRAEGMGFDPALKDGAVEVGGHPGPVSFAVAVFNGMEGGVPLDSDSRKGVSGRADVTLRKGAVGLTVGGSGWWNVKGNAPREEVHEESRVREAKVGGYLMAHAGRFTLLAEVDHRRVEDVALEETRRWLVSYAELSFLPVRGLDLQLIWEWKDPDMAIKPNSLHRVGAGFELFPLPYVELKLLYRHTFAETEVGLTDPRTFPWAANDGLDEILVFVHAYL